MASKPVYDRQHRTTNNIWTTGQIIEADLLNNMQNQIAQNTQGFSNIVSYSDTQPSGDYSQYNQIWLKKANSSTDSIKLAEVKDLDKVVMVSQEQPNDNLNKLWIKDNDNVVQVPSFGEFSQSIEDNIAPLYLNSATYSIGQYVTYENKLYMCQTAVTIPGEWSANSNHFIQTSIAGPLEYEGSAKGGWPNINANILNRLNEENSNRIQSVNILQNKVNNIENSIAPVYSEISYNIDDYCMHDGKLYKCKSAIVNGEEWDSTHWTQVKVDEEVSDLKNAVNATDRALIDSETSMKPLSQHISTGQWQADHTTTTSSLYRRTNTLELASGIGYIALPLSGYEFKVLVWTVDDNVYTNTIDTGYRTEPFYFDGAANIKYTVSFHRIGGGTAPNTNELLSALQMYKFYDIGALKKAVLYAPQSLTDAQKTQVRENIDSVSTTDLSNAIAGLNVSEIRNTLNVSSRALIDDDTSMVPASNYISNGEWLADHTTTSHSYYRRTNNLNLTFGIGYIALPLTGYEFKVLVWTVVDDVYTNVIDTGYRTEPFFFDGAENIKFTVSFHRIGGGSAPNVNEFLPHLQICKLHDINNIKALTDEVLPLKDKIGDTITTLNLLWANKDDEIINNGVTISYVNQNSIRVVSDGVRDNNAVNFYTSIFNGEHYVRTAGSGNKFLKAGTYTMKWDIELPNGLAYYYSEGGVTSGTKVVSGEPFTLATDGYIYLYVTRVFADTTGVEITFALYSGESDAAFPILSETATAVDAVARNRSEGILAGKTIVFFGDSIIGSFSPPTDIPTYVKKYTGANVINLGFGGSRMQDIGYDGPGQGTAHDIRHMLSMYRLAESIGLGDFQQQYDSLLNEYLPSQGQADYEVVKAKVDTLAAIDFTKVDIILLEHGTNDATYGAPIDGLNGHNNPAYKPSLQFMVNTIQNLYPNVRIVLCTPIYRKAFSTVEGVDSNSFERNGVHFSDYGNAMKEVAAEFNLLLIDNYNIGINKYTWSYYLRDTIHPNERGRELMARNIAQHIV